LCVKGSDGIVYNAVQGNVDVSDIANSYKIVGNKIYANDSKVTIQYCCPLYDKVADVNNNLPTPDYMTDLIKEMVVFFALNRNEFNTSVEQMLVERFRWQVTYIVSMYGFGNIERPMPYVV